MLSNILMANKKLKFEPKNRQTEAENLDTIYGQVKLYILFPIK
jgi:hypothetical protein